MDKEKYIEELEQGIYDLSGKVVKLIEYIGKLQDYISENDDYPEELMKDMEDFKGMSTIEYLACYADDNKEFNYKKLDKMMSEYNE